MATIYLRPKLHLPIGQVGTILRTHTAEYHQSPVDFPSIEQLTLADPNNISPWHQLTCNIVRQHRSTLAPMDREHFANKFLYGTFLPDDQPRALETWQRTFNEHDFTVYCFWKNIWTGLAPHSYQKAYGSCHIGH